MQRILHLGKKSLTVTIGADPLSTFWPWVSWLVFVLESFFWRPALVSHKWKSTNAKDTPTTEEPGGSGEGWLSSQAASLISERSLSKSPPQRGPQVSACGCGECTGAMGVSDVDTAHNQCHLGTQRGSGIGGRKNKRSGKTGCVCEPFHWTWMKSPHPPGVQLLLPCSVLWGLQHAPSLRSLGRAGHTHLSSSGLWPPLTTDAAAFFCWWLVCSHLVFRKHKTSSG